MQTRPIHLVLSALVHAAFLAIVTWTVPFLAGVLLPRTVDGPVRRGALPAVAVDLALLLLFAVQHSVMARRPVKRALRRWWPAELERTAFVAATVGCLALIAGLWQPVEGWVWRIDGAAAYLLWSGYAAGWLLAVAATFVVDHLDFTGLRQAGWARRAPDAGPPFRERGLYGIVRHPMMTGLLLAVWCTPRMSRGHLLYAVAASLYIAVGVRFEERDLRREIPGYDAYAARVPAVVPLPRRARRPRPGVDVADPSRVTRRSSIRPPAG